MPYKDSEKQRDAMRKINREYRARNRKQLLELKHAIEDLENEYQKYCKGAYAAEKGERTIIIGVAKCPHCGESLFSSGDI